MLSLGVLTDAVDAVAGLVVRDLLMPSTILPETTEAQSDGELAEIGTSPSLLKISMQASMRLWYSSMADATPGHRSEASLIDSIATFKCPSTSSRLCRRRTSW